MLIDFRLPINSVLWKCGNKERWWWRGEWNKKKVSFSFLKRRKCNKRRISYDEIKKFLSKELLSVSLLSVSSALLAVVHTHVSRIPLSADGGVIKRNSKIPIHICTKMLCLRTPLKERFLWTFSLSFGCFSMRLESFLSHIVVVFVGLTKGKRCKEVATPDLCLWSFQSNPEEELAKSPRGSHKSSSSNTRKKKQLRIKRRQQPVSLDSDFLFRVIVSLDSFEKVFIFFLFHYFVWAEIMKSEYEKDCCIHVRVAGRKQWSRKKEVEENEIF